MPSAFDKQVSMHVSPALQREFGESETYYYIPPGRKDPIAIKGGILGQVQTEPDVNPRTGNVTMVETSSLTIPTHVLEQKGVKVAEHMARVKTPNGEEWKVDPQRTNWQVGMVMLGLKRAPLAALNEMRKN